MANEYDLKIKSMMLTGGAGVIDNVLGKVDAGKTRFVCFIKKGCGANATTITIGVCDDAVAIDPAEVVDVTPLAALTTLAYPDGVDVDNPMFSMAGGTYLNANSLDATAGANDDELAVVYYDE